MSELKEAVLDSSIDEMEQDGEELLSINLSSEAEEEFNEERVDIQDPPVDALESLANSSQDYLSDS